MTIWRIAGLVVLLVLPGVLRRWMPGWLAWGAAIVSGFLVYQGMFVSALILIAIVSVAGRVLAGRPETKPGSSIDGAAPGGDNPQLGGAAVGDIGTAPGGVASGKVEGGANDANLARFKEMVLTHRDYVGSSYEAQASQLFAIYRKHDAFLGEAKEDARRVGTEINAAGGFEAMRLVCETIRSVLGGTPGRHLEKAWHGIGQWLG
jgi:hypothetical protein